MNRPIAWIAGAAVVALGFALFALEQVRAAPPADALGAFERRLALLESAPAATGATPDLAPLERTLSEVAARLERLEAEARRAPVESPPAPVPEATPASGRTAKPVDEAARRELESLLALFGPDFDFQGTPEQMQRFYELARDAGLLDASIAELEARVASDPADLAARMQLADRYVAKLMTIPHGAEQGLWGGKAEEQWRAVLERDPDHWQASFSLGNDFAYYPDVMGKTKDAIRYFEQARRIQETGAPQEEQVRVYLALSRLYLRQGERDQARAVLTSGLARHPTNAEIRAALDELE